MDQHIRHFSELMSFLRKAKYLLVGKQSLVILAIIKWWADHITMSVTSFCDIIHCGVAWGAVKSIHLFSPKILEEIKVFYLLGNSGMLLKKTPKNCIHNTFQYCITCKHCKISTRTKEYSAKCLIFFLLQFHAFQKKRIEKRRCGWNV